MDVDGPMCWYARAFVCWCICDLVVHVRKEHLSAIVQMLELLLLSSTIGNVLVRSQSRITFNTQYCYYEEFFSFGFLSKEISWWLKYVIDRRLLNLTADNEMLSWNRFYSKLPVTCAHVLENDHYHHFQSITIYHSSRPESQSSSKQLKYIHSFNCSFYLSAFDIPDLDSDLDYLIFRLWIK